MSNKADYLSIGEIIAESLNIETSSLETLGIEFCNYYDSSKSPRHILKLLNFDMIGEDILSFGLERNDVINSKTVKIRTHCAKLTFRIIKNASLLDKKTEAMFIFDTANYCKEFVLLDGLESLGKGEGTKLVKEVLDVCYKTPVLIQAGYLYFGDYETMNEEDEPFKVVNNLVKLYKDIGFSDVNSVIGGYENSRIMLHADSKLISKIMEDEL